jgi:hypothetical protein
MAAVIPVIKVIGVALSAKSMIEGIKDGNFLQAVIGGIGAYYGMQGLGNAAGSVAQEGVAEGAKQTVSTAGAEVSEKVASQAAAKGVTEAASSLTPLAESISSELTEAAGGAAGGASLTATGSSVASDLAGATLESGKGLIGQAMETPWYDKVLSGGKKVMGWAEKHPELTSTGLKLAGGYLQAKAEEDRFNQLNNQEMERRRRRGQTANYTRQTRLRFDPNTRRMVVGG